MADETVYQGTPAEDRTGYCQDCGQPLTATTMRKVGSAVYCEPCLEHRMTAANTAAGPQPGAAAGPNASGFYQGAPFPGGANQWGGQYPPPDGVFPPLDGSTPHPVLAALLGLIPGVGAMYNGQFAKGIAHFLVFAILVSLSNSVNGFFGLFVACWEFYMVFDAYHTAKARRAGQPLPDPLGLNHIGDRLGIRNWSGGPARPAGASWQPGQTGPYPPPSPAPGTAPDWVGYVPPTNYATQPPSAGATVPNVPVPPPPVYPYAASTGYAENLAANIHAQAAQDAAYQQTFTGASPVAGGPVVPLVPHRRFPTAAIWLLVLGALFLPGTINPDWHVSFRWTVPLLLALFSMWLTVRRMGWLGGFRASGSLICALRWPAILMTLAVLFALQDWRILTLGQTWPVLLIVLGGFLLLERVTNRPEYGPAGPVIDETVPPVGTGSWAATSDSSKGGQ
ncbi:MAG TPA: hypothetical protein VGN16_02100 [Acidobacteriaceae bacterium]|jgi:hypothetical protein